MPSKPGRTLCQACNRPPVVCYCRWATPISNQIELLILQHPTEAGHPKNTAGLLAACLMRTRLMIGESFGAELEALLQSLPRPALLYPDTPTGNTIALHEKPETLIILDATWRKSRKMLYLNPLLSRLPRVNLPAGLPGNYHIRKTQGNNLLSTFEASCYALQQLESRPDHYRPALTAFTAYIQHLAGFTPKHHHAAR